MFINSVEALEANQLFHIKRLPLEKTMVTFSSIKSALLIA